MATGGIAVARDSLERARRASGVLSSSTRQMRAKSATPSPSPKRRAHATVTGPRRAGVAATARVTGTVRGVSPVLPADRRGHSHSSTTVGESALAAEAPTADTGEAGGGGVRPEDDIVASARLLVPRKPRVPVTVRAPRRASSPQGESAAPMGAKSGAPAAKTRPKSPLPMAFGSRAAAAPAQTTRLRPAVTGGGRGGIASARGVGNQSEVSVESTKVTAPSPSPKAANAKARQLPGRKSFVPPRRPTPHAAASSSNGVASTASRTGDKRTRISEPPATEDLAAQPAIEEGSDSPLAVAGSSADVPDDIGIAPHALGGGFLRGLVALPTVPATVDILVDRAEVSPTKGTADIAVSSTTAARVVCAPFADPLEDAERNGAAASHLGSSIKVEAVRDTDAILRAAQALRHEASELGKAMHLWSQLYSGDDAEIAAFPSAPPAAATDLIAEAQRLEQELRQPDGSPTALVCHGARRISKELERLRQLPEPWPSAPVAQDEYGSSQPSKAEPRYYRPDARDATGICGPVAGTLDVFNVWDISEERSQASPASRCSPASASGAVHLDSAAPEDVSVKQAKCSVVVVSITPVEDEESMSLPRSRTTTAPSVVTTVVPVPFPVSTPHGVGASLWNAAAPGPSCLRSSLPARTRMLTADEPRRNSVSPLRGHAAPLRYSGSLLPIGVPRSTLPARLEPVVERASPAMSVPRSISPLCCGAAPPPVSSSASQFPRSYSPLIRGAAAPPPPVSASRVGIPRSLSPVRRVSADRISRVAVGLPGNFNVPVPRDAIASPLRRQPQPQALPHMAWQRRPGEAPQAPQVARSLSPLRVSHDRAGIGAVGACYQPVREGAAPSAAPAPESCAPFASACWTPSYQPPVALGLGQRPQQLHLSAQSEPVLPGFANSMPASTFPGPWPISVEPIVFRR